MVRINWTIQARDDLRNIAEFISKDSKFYAKLQVLRLKNRTHILKTQLHSGKIVTEINIENIRELIEA
jgi:toxin ParE1/3/4